MDGEKYLFLVPTKTYLFEVGNDNTELFKGATNDDYLILTKEPNGHYSCIYVTIKVGSLTMKELLLDSEKCAVKNVKNKETIKGDFNTYILNPTQKEWAVLFSCFVMYDEYTGAF